VTDSFNLVMPMHAFSNKFGPEWNFVFKLFVFVLNITVNVYM